MARRIEQGSVLGFVLVGALLVALLAGGVYVVRHMQSTGDTTAPAAPSADDKNTADNGSSAPAKPSTSNDDQLKAALDSQSKDKKKESDTPSNTPAPSSTSSSGSSNSASSASALPKTGPEQVIGPMLGAALLVASAVSYTRSRRLI